MANSFLGSEEVQGVIDIAYEKIRVDRAMDNINICEYRQEMLTQKLKEVNDSLTNLRKEHGIIYPERQIERLTEDDFRCMANFSYAENSVDLQNIIPDEMTFNFKLKNFESPSGCNALKEEQLRRCWVLESTESV